MGGALTPQSHAFQRMPRGVRAPRLQLRLMIFFLRLLFLVVLGSMVAVTTWAGLHQPLGEFARSATFREPWVVATLLDAYWAFVSFYVWVAWKEQGLAARILWFVAIILLGNIAIASYLLAGLFRIPRDLPAAAALTQLFTHRQPGRLALPGALVALATGIYAFA